MLIQDKTDKYNIFIDIIKALPYSLFSGNAQPLKST